MQINHIIKHDYFLLLYSNHSLNRYIISLIKAYKIGIISLLGPAPIAVLAFEAILNGMALFSHSNIKLPHKMDHLFRKIIVTPNMHRIHHSVEVNETNSNYGFNLSVWDRLLGTYKAEAIKTQSEIVIGIDTFRRPEELTFYSLLMMPRNYKKLTYVT